MINYISKKEEKLQGYFDKKKMTKIKIEYKMFIFLFC